MTLELNEAERTLLADLLEATYKDKLRELHHTTTNAYKEEVKLQVEIIESVIGKLAGAHV